MKRLIQNLLLGVVAIIGLGTSAPLFAQVVEGPQADGLTGSTQVAAGAQVVIYTVGFSEAPFPPGTTFDVGHAGNLGVRLTISDLTAPTGLASSDFTNLQLYRSTDNVFSSGADFLLATNTTVSIGGMTTLDAFAGGSPNRTISEGTVDYLFVTATIASNATPGHTFRVGAALNHVGFQRTPPGISDNGTGFAAADGDHIVIAAQSPSFTNKVAGGGRGIPFGGEPAILALLIGSGLYMIRRASR